MDKINRRPSTTIQGPTVSQPLIRKQGGSRPTRHRPTSWGNAKGMGSAGVAFAKVGGFSFF